jgi:demethylmenaquinone methyltransferase/2-methoxy-6-polyprenyl-1,4-benzoquinol methylase
LFDRIAPRYDLVNDVQSFGFHRIWKRRLLVSLKLCSQDRFLDLCCGSGDLALVGSKSVRQVVGLDFSQPMLDVAAARKGAEKEGSKVTWIRGNAMELPFADDSFDAVSIAYGLRNLASFNEGLAEIHRVLRPSGRIAILEFGIPQNAVWKSIWYVYLNCVVPVFGALFFGDRKAYSYILESLNHYPAQKGVLEALHQLGFQNINLVNYFGGMMSLHTAVKASS